MHEPNQSFSPGDAFFFRFVTTFKHVNTAFFFHCGAAPRITGHIIFPNSQKKQDFKSDDNLSCMTFLKFNAISARAEMNVTA